MNVLHRISTVSVLLVLSIIFNASWAIANEPPDCSEASPGIMTVWPPDKKFVDVTVEGVTDPDGDAVIITIVEIQI